MIELQQNRYLWVHFAGLACVPLLLDICLAGLASAGPALPFQGQFWAIALFGILPALAMQWLKPFYVFSLPPSALKPAALSEDQRRCLQIFKSWQIKALALLVAIFSLWLLAQIYVILPQIRPLLLPRAGLICGAIAFFTASTFMQISVSAGRALLIGPQALKRVPAVDESAIATDFLILGIRLNKLLPDAPTHTASESAEPTSATPESTTADAETTPASLSTEPLEQDTMPPTVEATTVSEPTVDSDDEAEIIVPEKLPAENESES
ncbi:MAG: low-complexity tail membrane protein [Phormidesmis sp.]